MIISSFSEFESDLLKKQKQKQKQKKQDKWQNFTDFRQDLRDQSFRTKKKQNKQNKYKGLLFFIQRCECYSRCDWSLPMICWSANTCMDDVTGKLCYLLCSTWRAVLNMLVRLFRIKQVKASKKV